MARDVFPPNKAAGKSCFMTNPFTFWERWPIASVVDSSKKTFGKLLSPDSRLPLGNAEQSSGSALRNQADPDLELEIIHYILKKVANGDGRIKTFCLLKSPRI